MTKLMVRQMLNITTRLGLEVGINCYHKTYVIQVRQPDMHFDLLSIQYRTQNKLEREQSY